MDSEGEMREIKCSLTFVKEMNVITNTQFKPKRRLYMWKVPDQTRHHLQYILVKRRFRNSTKDMQTLPEAHTDCDHNLIVAKI